MLSFRCSSLDHVVSIANVRRTLSIKSILKDKTVGYTTRKLIPLKLLELLFERTCMYETFTTYEPYNPMRFLCLTHLWREVLERRMMSDRIVAKTSFA